MWDTYAIVLPLEYLGIYSIDSKRSGYLDVISKMFNFKFNHCNISGSELINVRSKAPLE